MLPEDASMDTAGAGAAEGCHGALHGRRGRAGCCPRTPRWTRPAQAQLRAAMMRYMAAEGHAGHCSTIRAMDEADTH